MKRPFLWLMLLLMGGLWWVSSADSAGLKVVFSAPHDLIQRPEEGIVVTFDLPMVALGPASERPQGPLQLTPPASGSYRWLGVRTLAFYPAQLAPATRYTATVPAGTKAANGSSLAANYQFDFHTAQPEMEYTSGLLWQGVQPKAMIRFNMPMDANRAAPFIRLEKGPKLRVRAPRAGEVSANDKPEQVLVLEPQTAPKAGSVYQLKIAAGTLAASGNLGTAEEKTCDLTVPGPLRLEGLEKSQAHDPGDPLQFHFSNPVKARDLHRHLKMVPPAALLGSMAPGDATTYPRLAYQLRPDTRYRLTIDAGLQDEYGKRLNQPVSLDLQVSRLSPAVIAPLGERTLESYLPPQLPLGFLNTSSLRVRGARLSKESVVPALLKLENEKWIPSPLKLDRKWAPQARHNVLTYRPLDLQSLLQGGFGLMALRFDPADAVLVDSATQFSAAQKTTFVQVTRMGLTAKFSPDDVLIWVTDLENSASLPGTALEMRDADNKVVWKGKSDADGLARAPGWQKLGHSEPVKFFVIAQRGSDMAVVNSATGTSASEQGLGVNLNYTSPANQETLIFSDRGLYRPGDLVHLKGIQRQREGSHWVIPDRKTPLHLVIKDSRDQECFTQDVKLSERGSFDLSVPLAKQAATGQWSLWLGKDDQTANFRVEAYRPAQFKVEMHPARQDYIVGETLSAPIEARYLFGAPVAKGDLKWSAYAALATFESKEWPGMSFGPDRWVSWRDEDQDKPTSETLHSQVETQLDDKGQSIASVPLKLAYLSGPVDVTLQASVAAVDKSEITGRSVVHLHPAAVYVGLRPQATFVASHAPVSCAVVTIQPDGTIQPGQQVEVELLRREYRSVRRQTGNATRWVSVAKDISVGKTSLTSGLKESSVSLKTEGPGLYLWRARTQDAAGHLAETTSSIYVFGNELAGWQLQGDDRLQLVPDKRSYKPGETVRLAISSPFAKAQALVTVEREGILERFVSDVSGGAPVVRIPVRNDYAPNVFVSVALIQGRLGRDKFGSLGEDLARPAFRLGTVKIPVESEGQRLKVEISPDHQGYAPGDTVSVDLQVRDAAGQGAPAEVTFVAADQGVLNLIDYHLPDPMATFFRERSLSVETCETRFRVVGQRRYGEKGNPGGGGSQGDAPLPPQGSFRWNFEATPCWKPTIQTDNQGHARVTFQVPDTLTAFRLSAVAHQGSLFGRGEGEIHVSRALAMTPSWPRFCNLGDEATAGVMVHNQTGQSGLVNVTLHAQGAELTGPAEQQVQVPAGESRQLRFPFRASQAGQATFRFQAQLGALRDQLEAQVPVQLPILLETAAGRESVEQEPLTFGLDVPADVIPGTAVLDLAMSSSALAGLKPAVEYLRAYPYECLEQQISKVMPMVAAREVIEAFTGDKVESRKLVQEVLDGLPELQNDTGGLALWAGQKPSPWATAYALHLCARAQNQGYKLPQSTIHKALEYLQQALADRDDGERWAHPYSENETLSTQAYMLRVLALWGKQDAASANRLYEERQKLPVCAQSWLLLAMAKQPSQSKALARLILDHLVIDPASAHFKEGQGNLERTYDSPTRTSALALESLLESGQDFPQAALVVHWLVDQRKQGRWRTTQENAAVFSALSAWYRKREAVAPDFEASLQLAGQEVVRQAFKGRNLNILSKTLPLTTGPQSLQVSRQGSGTLYLSALLKYASRTAAPPADAGLSVVKTVEVVGAPATGGYPAGTLLRVRLTVCSGQPRSFVVVNDPVAAGLEVVQSDFASERQDLSSGDEERHWWGGFNHIERYDDRVLLFADELEAGVHHYTYYLRAAFPGRYRLPATLVDCMYEPEIFGRTGADEVLVR